MTTVNFSPLKRRRARSFFGAAVIASVLVLIAILPHPSKFSRETDLRRGPAQNAQDIQGVLTADPFILHYLNPRQDSNPDWSSCAQANECRSMLCLKGTCIPRYFSDIKASPGESCNSPDQCLSNVCDTGSMKCVGSTIGLCSYVGQYCNADPQCCSGTCDTTRNICLGDQVHECAPVGAICTSAQECCSGVGDHQCRGSSLDPAAAGELCNADAQCLSGICHSGPHIPGRCL